MGLRNLFRKKTSADYAEKLGKARSKRLEYEGRAELRRKLREEKRRVRVAKHGPTGTRRSVRFAKAAGKGIYKAVDKATEGKPTKGRRRTKARRAVYVMGSPRPKKKKESSDPWSGLGGW